MNSIIYTLCKHCDHFVEPNEEHETHPEYAAFYHLEDGEQEFDHDAEPGESHTIDEWNELRPDLFQEHPDGKIGPNSVFHSQRGKLPLDAA